MNFNVTDALHGARVTTVDGRAVVGLTHIKNTVTGGYPLTGFTRSRDGQFTSNTWTMDGRFSSNSQVVGDSDLRSEFVGFPWFSVDVIPSDHDGVQENKDGKEDEFITVYRFFDNKINKTWQGTWEDRGTATHWQSPGPTPRDFYAIIKKDTIKLETGAYLLESDYVIDGGRFKPMSETPWAKAKIGEKHDGTFVAIRLPIQQKPSA